MSFTGRMRAAGAPSALALGLALVLALGFPAQRADAEVRSLVATGHSGPVLDMQYDEKRDLIFTAGDDGMVKIWSGHDGSLLRSFAVTAHAAQMIAVDPAGSRVAVIATDGLRAFSLAVWDWEQETQVSRIILKDAPLFIRFSGQGTYIVYAVSAWQGLRIINAETGQPVSFSAEGIGIVAFAEISRSEKTLMAYQISGRISYWDLDSGSLMRDVPTVPYLARLRMSRDRRYLIGNTGKEIVLVDAYTGIAVGRARAAGDTALDISPAGDRIAGVPVSGGGLSQWAVTADALVPQQTSIAVSAGTSPRAPSADSFQVLCYGSDSLFLGSTDGALSRLSDTGEMSAVSRNILAPITGIDAARGLLAVGGPDWIRVFSSDALEGAAGVTSVRSMLIDNPWKSPVGLSFLTDTTLLAWSRDDKPPRFALLELPAPFPSRWGPGEQPAVRFREIPSGFRAPLVDLAALGSRLLGVETGGAVRLVDLATGAPQFETRVPAVSTIVQTSSAELVGGRNTTLAPGGSLVRINTSTGETVGVSGKNVFTWDLLFDSSGIRTGRPTLYAIGVDNEGSTNVVAYDGAGFERESVVATLPEEDLDATLALDPVTHAVFAAVGRARVVAWDGQTATPLSFDLTTTRKLLARNGLLISLNRDSTIALRNQATGSLVAELSLFSDGEWAAVTPGGGYLASPGGDARIRVFQDDVPVDAREDYRLRMESW